MRIQVDYCTIVDVEDASDKNGGGNRKMTLQMQEEDFFAMLDTINPKNIVKYLDMRFINHREAPVINIYDCVKQRMSDRNRKKLDRALFILDSIRVKEKV